MNEILKLMGRTSGTEKRFKNSLLKDVQKQLQMKIFASY